MTTSPPRRIKFVRRGADFCLLKQNLSVSRMETNGCHPTVSSQSPLRLLTQFGVRAVLSSEEIPVKGAEPVMTARDSGARGKRAVQVVLVVLGALVTALMWSGISLRDLLHAFR